MSKTFNRSAFHTALLGLPLVFSANAFAEFDVSVTLASDYRLYGVSQTLEEPTLQFTGVYIDESGFSAGTFLSNVDFVENTDPDDLDVSIEIDLFVGYEKEVATGHLLSATLIRYIYPGAEVDLDYNELIINYGFAYGALTVGYSNDAFAADETGIRYEYSYGFDINEEFSVGFMVGHYDLDDVFGDSYRYYDVGVTYAYEDFAFTLSYNDSSSAGEDLFGPAAEAAVVGAVSYSF